jgi:hypothetical protein
VIVNDRLLVPNTAESFVALESDIQSFFNALYGGAEDELEHLVNPRERFTVNVKTGTSFDVETLLKNISVETAHA